MAGENTEVLEKEIVVAIDPPVEDTAEKPDVRVELKKPENDAVADLKSQYEESQKRTKDAEQRARDAEQRVASERAARQEAEKIATTAKAEVVDREYDTIIAGLDHAKRDSDSAEEEYKTAMEAGDFTKAAKAQRRMAEAVAKATRLDEAKSYIDERKANPEKIEVKPAARQQADDPLEAYIQGRSAPTQKWLRDHTEWVTDPKKNMKLTAAHMDAVASDLAPDSDEYFAHVEKFIGLKKDEPVQQRTPARRSAPVAPVNGGTGSGYSGTGGGTEVRLSAREAAAAQDGTHVWNYDDTSPQKRFKKGEPIGIQEFARRKQKMQADGLYDKTALEQ